MLSPRAVQKALSLPFLHSRSHLCDSRIEKSLALFLLSLFALLATLHSVVLAVIISEVLISIFSSRALVDMHHSIEFGHIRGWKCSSLSYRYIYLL